MNCFKRKIPTQLFSAAGKVQSNLNAGGVSREGMELLTAQVLQQVEARHDVSKGLLPCGPLSPGSGRAELTFLFLEAGQGSSGTGAFTSLSL